MKYVLIPIQMGILFKKTFYDWLAFNLAVFGRPPCKSKSLPLNSTMYIQQLSSVVWFVSKTKTRVRDTASEKQPRFRALTRENLLCH